MHEIIWRVLTEYLLYAWHWSRDTRQTILLLGVCLLWESVSSQQTAEVKNSTRSPMCAINFWMQQRSQHMMKQRQWPRGETWQWTARTAWFSCVYFGLHGILDSWFRRPRKWPLSTLEKGVFQWHADINFTHDWFWNANSPVLVSSMILLSVNCSSFPALRFRESWWNPQAAAWRACTHHLQS